MSDCIDGLNLPLSYFLTTLKSSLKTDLTPTIVGTKRIDEGQGYLSMIAQLKLQWPANTSKELPTSVVVKLPTMNKINAEMDRVQAECEVELPPFDDFLLSIHNAECNFYSRIGTHLKAQYKVPLGHIYHTKAYECQTAVGPTDLGVIVMEDFVGRGRTPDFSTEVFDETQVQLLIDSIASLHAYCLTNPTWNEGNVFEVQDPEKMGPVAQYVSFNLGQIRTQYPEYLTASDEDIAKISNPDEMYEVLNKDTSKLDYFVVLVHGDLWTNNTIFARDENNHLKDELLAIIDWQTCHPGPVSEDFTRLLTSSVDPELRRANTHKWLEFYYKRLGEKLPKGHKIPFSFDEVLRMYKKTFRMGTLFLGMHIPVVLNNPKLKFTEEQKIMLVKRMQADIEDSIASLSE